MTSPPEPTSPRSPDDTDVALDQLIKQKQLDKLQAELAQISADRQLKDAQRDKLAVETRHLQGLSLETGGKVLVAILGISAAAFTLWIGVPQSKLELATVQGDLVKRQQALTALQQDTAGVVAERDRASNQLSLIQRQAQAVAEELKKQNVAQGQPASPLTAKLIADTQPRLFVQFAGELNRVKVIDPLRQEIAGKGFVVPPAERINRDQSNEVRYFINDEATRKSAQQVADLTAAYFERLGCPIPQIKVRLLTLPDGKQSPTELWLQHSCSRG